MINKEIISSEQIIRDRVRAEGNISRIENINKIDFSYNFNFNDDSLTESHTDTKVEDGLLLLNTVDDTEGTWISNTRTVPTIITKLELRYVGKDLGNSFFFYSLHGGEEGSWVKFSGRNILITPSDQGRKLKLKIEIREDNLNPAPNVDSGEILYT